MSLLELFNRIFLFQGIFVEQYYLNLVIRNEKKIIYIHLRFYVVI